MKTRTYKGQKAGLTRAVKTGDEHTIRAEVMRAIREWDAGSLTGDPDKPYWPDYWMDWARAFEDTGLEFPRY